MRDTAIKAIKSAGAILLKSVISDKFPKADKKAENDIETEADRQSGREIRRIVLESFPGHSIKLEENSLNVVNDSPYLWVVDSIAGTIHFDAKIPHFGINLALIKDNEPILGLNYFPYTDDLYVAEKGKGAYHISERLGLNKRMRVNTISDAMEGILLLCSGKSMEKRIWTGKIFNAVIPHFRQVDKFSNSQEAGLLGTTKAVGYIANSAHYWDFLAHKLIIEESGGKVTDIEGNPITEETKNVIYSNGLLHDYIVGLVKGLR